MSQLTRCPNCATTFRVSEAQLALRGGRVRCGHCSFVFNALACQVDADPVTIVDLGADGAHREHDPFWDPQPAVESPPASLLPGGDTRSEVEWPTVPVPDEEEAPSTAPVSADVWVEQLQELPPPAWLKTPSASEPAPEPEAVVNADEFVPRTRLDETAEQTPQPNHNWLRPVGPSRWRWLWRLLNLLALVSALLLAALLWRQALVGIYPPARPLLAKACERLGCKVYAPQNHELLFLEGIEFSFDPEDVQRLELRALLRNTAPYAQSWPLIDVQLLDKQGQRVARRLLKPAQYLPPQESGNAEFGALLEVQISVQMHLQGVNVDNYTVGFHPAR